MGAARGALKRGLGRGAEPLDIHSKRELMRNGLRKFFGILLLGALALGLAASAPAEAEDKKKQEGITKEQADAILKELQEIRRLLEQQQQPAAAQRPQRPQPPPTIKVKLEKEYALGREDAPLTLVEFLDYQCPFCQRFHQESFEQLKKNFIDTGKLRFVNRDLPLTSIHPNAMHAAVAARCAGEQGKFWEFRNVLISNARDLRMESVLRLAGEAGLDTKAFQSCLDSDRFDADIQRHMNDAATNGISGTPTFALGKTSPTGEFEGARLVGAQPYAAIEARINQLVAAAAAKPGGSN